MFIYSCACMDNIWKVGRCLSHWWVIKGRKFYWHTKLSIRSVSLLWGGLAPGLRVIQGLLTQPWTIICFVMWHIEAFMILRNVVEDDLPFVDWDWNAGASFNFSFQASFNFQPPCHFHFLKKTGQDLGCDFRWCRTGQFASCEHKLFCLQSFALLDSNCENKQSCGLMIGRNLVVNETDEDDDNHLPLGGSPQ